MVKLLWQWMSPAGPNARLSILIFHRVLPAPDALFPAEMHANRFNQICGWLRSWANVLPLDEAASRLKAGTLPARAACITFDDGYADNCEVALPILKSHGLPATFFVATGFLDGGRMWNDSVIEAVRAFPGKVLDLGHAGLGIHSFDSLEQRRGAIDTLLARTKYLEPGKRAEAVRLMEQSVGRPLPDDLMMSSAQVMKLRHAGMQIGAHTCSHPILASLADAPARAEINQSKLALESLLDEPVTLFAYPNGKPGKDYLPSHVEAVRDAAFAAAVSTAPGACFMGSDPLQLPRFTPWDTGRLRYGGRMLSNLRTTPHRVFDPC